MDKFAEIQNLPYQVKLVAYEESAKQGETSMLTQALSADATSVVCAFGPEGGFSPEEIQQLQAHEFSSIGLGPRIMRAETAPMYFLSVLSYKYELETKWGMKIEKPLVKS